jgi:hypothetical protein
VEDVAGDDDDIGGKLDRLVDRVPERSRDIRLALVDPSRGQTLILAIAEVEVA